MVLAVKINDRSIFNFDSLKYKLVLNGVSEFELVVLGVSGDLRGDLAPDNVVKVYNSGSLEFEGVVVENRNVTGGGVVVRGVGAEVVFAESEPPVDSGKRSKVYKSSNSNAIFVDLVSAVSGWSSDVTGSTSVGVGAFRTSQSAGVWKSIIALLDLVDKDIFVDYGSKIIYLKDRQGSSGVFKFVEDFNVSDVVFSEKRKKASKVVVYGKGEGDSQIVGSSGSGTPVMRITDINIISKSEADNRAAKELALVSSNLKNYVFNVSNPNLVIGLGDGGVLSAGSVGLDNAVVDVVSFSRGVNNSGVFLVVEVANSEYRKAEKSLMSVVNKSEYQGLLNESSMNGSGNTMSWGSGINAKNSYPLRLGFFVPTEYFEDEAGNETISSLKLDYQVVPYRAEYGDASYIGGDAPVSDTSGLTTPSFSGSSGSTAPGVNGSSGSTTPGMSGSVGNNNDIGVRDVAEENSGSSYSTSGWRTIFNFGSRSGDWAIVNVPVSFVGTSGYIDIRVRMGNSSTYYPSSSGFRINVPTDVHSASVVILIGDAFSSTTINVQASNSCTFYGWGQFNSFYKHNHTNTIAANSHDHSASGYSVNSHDHSASGYSVGSHDHPAGSYEVKAADIGDFTIGSGVDEAASVNATSVNIYLDYYDNSTSSWVNKHSILSTGSIFSSDVDITNGGVYPDSTGYWRVRIDTNSANPDFVQSVIRLRHSLDN